MEEKKKYEGRGARKMEIKKVLRLIIVGIVFTGLLAGITGCAIGPDNIQFTVRLSGPPGAEFTGSCTYKVKDLIGSRTLEAEVQGAFTDGKTTIEYTIAGTEISGKITNKTPEKPITIVLLKDGIEVRRVDELGEGEAYLAWYPPITVDTEAQEAKGYRYEPVEPAGNVVETGYFTDEETNKIDGLIEKIAPETKQQFEEQYQALITAINEPAYAVRSDPFWKTTGPYENLLKSYQDEGDKILPFIFQKLEGGQTLADHSVGSLLADIASEKHPDVLAQIQFEDLHGRYTEDGLYILPYSASTVRLAKGLLAVL
jgi:hypothetical protein